MLKGKAEIAPEFLEKKPDFFDKVSFF